MFIKYLFLYSIGLYIRTNFSSYFSLNISNLDDFYDLKRTWYSSGDSDNNMFDDDLSFGDEWPDMNAVHKKRKSKVIKNKAPDKLPKMIKE